MYELRMFWSLIIKKQETVRTSIFAINWGNVINIFKYQIPLV